MREELFCTFPDCECPVSARGCMRYVDEEQKRYVDAYARARHQQTSWSFNYPTFVIIAVVAAAIIGSLWGISSAWPSDMNYCRPYADQFTEKFRQYVWNRAYSTCLNSYGDPAVPKDWKSATDVVNGDEVDYTGLVGDVPAIGAPLNVDTDPLKTAWRAACAREYRTWDPKTETVVRSKRSRRVTCPCGTGVVCK